MQMQGRSLEALKTGLMPGYGFAIPLALVYSLRDATHFLTRLINNLMRIGHIQLGDIKLFVVQRCIQLIGAICCAVIAHSILDNLAKLQRIATDALHGRQQMSGERKLCQVLGFATAAEGRRRY